MSPLVQTPGVAHMHPHKYQYFFDFYIQFQRQFKKTHGQVIETMPVEFSNKEYIERFKYMFPDKILLIDRERNYWYGKRIIRKTRSRFNYHN